MLSLEIGSWRMDESLVLKSMFVYCDIGMKPRTQHWLSHGKRKMKFTLFEHFCLKISWFLGYCWLGGKQAGAVVSPLLLSAHRPLRVCRKPHCQLWTPGTLTTHSRIGRMWEGCGKIGTFNQGAWECIISVVMLKTSLEFLQCYI